MGAVRIDDFKFQFFQQPYGWPGRKDYDRHAHHGEHPAGSVRANANRFAARHLTPGPAATCNDFYAREFWRFVMVQEYVGKLAKTAIDYPPMQDPATFNLDAIKQKIQAAIKQHEGE